MKLKHISGVVVLIALVLSCSSFRKKTDNQPWTEKQLLAPAELADMLNSGKMENTYIFNIGPAGKIKNSVAIGATEDEGNLEQLKEKLTQIPKSAEVIIYCGCCPFEHCPNVRPAFNLLKEMKFANARLLNLPKNLKADWIDKGYPMQD
jgi:hypothetical protein